MSEAQFPSFYEQQKQRVDESLEELLPEHPSSELVRAMRYSTLQGGKRIRGVMVLEVERAGYEDNHRTKAGELLAGAVELIHAYSLVHDDLPAMDDDDMRRGQPACHVEYGEDIAILAGNGLLTLAYETLAEIEDAGIRERALDRIGEAAGYGRLLDGQYRDLHYEDNKPTADEILDMYTRKTGALLGLSMELGAISALLPERQCETFRILGTDLGVAFQIRDDLLEQETDDEDLGKSTDSDADSEKWTYARLVGETRARDRAESLIKDSRDRLESLDLDTGRVSQLANFILERTY